MNDRLQALFERLPFNEALAELTPAGPRNDLQDLASSAVENQPPEVQAALWLYVDDLVRSHTISQGIETPTGSYWHGIMHRREGDFSNAKYWFRKVGAHPVIAQVGYDPFAFIDNCARRQDDSPPELVELQRKEWKALFDWCLKEQNK